MSDFSTKVSLTKIQITTLLDHVEFFEPPRLLHRMRKGLWVEFCDPKAFARRKRRGYVREVRDACAVVIDEWTWEEVC